MRPPHSAHFRDIATHLRRELADAHYSIKLAIAWLTEKSLLTALTAAARRGVAVEVVVSRHEFNRLGIYDALLAAGAQVMLYGPAESRERDFLHHKFCVVDYQTVITGSFNWSQNAASNQENIVIVRDDEHLAAQYLAAFQELFLHGAFLPTDGIRQSESLLARLLGRRTESYSAPTLRFWATHALGWPGQPVTLLWQAPTGMIVRLSDHVEEVLPAEGRLEVPMPDVATVYTLTASLPDAEAPALTRKLLLRPARLPEIEFFALTPPTIVAHALSARLHWRVRHADVVTIDPFRGEQALTGEMTVSPTSSTTYTLTARGLGGRATRSVTLGVFPMPVLQSLQVPAPAGLRVDLQLAYHQIPVPSGLNLSASRPAYQMPSVVRLRTELAPPRVTAQQVAHAYGLTSPADLRLPPRPEAPLTRWRHIKQTTLQALERRFAHNWRLTHLLSTLRKLYG